MGREFAARDGGLALAQIPNDDICIFLVFGFARTCGTVSLVACGNAENLKGVSVQLLLFWPKSFDHKYILDRGLGKIFYNFIYLGIAKNLHRIIFRANATSSFLFIDSYILVGKDHHRLVHEAQRLLLNLRAHHLFDLPVSSGLAVSQIDVFSIRVQLVEHLHIREGSFEQPKYFLITT